MLPDSGEGRWISVSSQSEPTPHLKRVLLKRRGPMPPVYEFNSPFFFTANEKLKGKFAVADIPHNAEAGIYLAVSSH